MVRAATPVNASCGRVTIRVLDSWRPDLTSLLNQGQWTYSSHPHVETEMLPILNTKLIEYSDKNRLSELSSSRRKFSHEGSFDVTVTSREGPHTSVSSEVIRETRLAVFQGYF